MRRSLAILLLLAACGRDRPGTDIQKLQLDLAFGVKAAAAPVPANFGPDIALSDVELPLPDDEPPSRKFRPPLPQPIECAEAALNAFPAKEAGFNVEGPVPVGRYRWMREGSQTLTAVPGITIPIGGFEIRFVRRAQTGSGTETTFQTVQPGPGSLTTVTSWTVNTGATVVPVNPVVAQPVRIGEPERGLVLSRIEYLDSEGTTVRTFTPTPGILMLGLPVVAGEQWTAQGTDTSTGQVLQHSGTVAGRERVDACGEVVDGWKVTGTQTIQDAAGLTIGTRDYTYIVATQFGGILILEQVKGQTAEGSIDATFRLGHVEPDPLPEEHR